ncbi:anoctamin-5-like [Oratosquilla oratoria]|uniref:anoctamin-5-like n=1 Tax=Oratosquilla oratoria TaxID=337810 RepID=UPI003F767330
MPRFLVSSEAWGPLSSSNSSSLSSSRRSLLSGRLSPTRSHEAPSSTSDGAAHARDGSGQATNERRRSHGSAAQSLIAEFNHLLEKFGGSTGNITGSKTTLEEFLNDDTPVEELLTEGARRRSLDNGILKGPAPAAAEDGEPQPHVAPEPSRPSSAKSTMWAEAPSDRAVKRRGSYEGVHLPGTIMDDHVPLAENDIFSYNKYEASKIKKASDVTKVRRMVETVFFRDNKRRIDFVLVYKDDEDLGAVERRKMFEKNLEEEGLELELEDKSQSQDGQTYYLKVHAPWDLLVRYAEIMKLKKPIKQNNIQSPKKWNIFHFFGMKNPFLYDEDLIPPEPMYFSTGFNRNRMEQFIIKDRETFFNPSQRSQIVWEILLRVRYSEDELGVGISRLLANESYVAAFPLHDGRYDKDGPGGLKCDRRLLFLEWARGAKWFKQQPLHVIRRYFGEKMGLYFAWLGFYTQMLIPAAGVGVLTFICGLFFMNSEFNKPSQEICNKNGTGSLKMCPLCDELCDFWDLSDSCLNSRISFLFDNPATVFFSVAMSFWATMFLELWKRKQAVIQWQWDLEYFEEEEDLRPEFEEKVKTTRINPVTNKPEPYLPFLNRLTRYVAANSLVLMMLFLVIAAVFGVILYRMAVGVTMYQVGSDLFQRNAKLVTSISAATLNLIVILVLNYFYEKVVLWLTNLEVPRTESEYEASFTLKMFFFQFINFYSSLIYIAFFKGRFFYHPGDKDVRRDLLSKMRFDMCDPAGCLFELCVQLGIIMVGKQLASNVVEILLPILRVWWNKKTGHDNQMSESYTRWEQDYDLQEFTRLSLFNEYLEMVIQYGFVTLFVAAFPLAPLFALINNVFEIRLDAYKYLTQCRRPKADRVQDIGIWFSILKGITYLSVLTNALVISYTSDFIPRLVYMYGYTDSLSLSGYIENTLAVFNTSQYGKLGPRPEVRNRTAWPMECHYRAYRSSPNEDPPYSFTLQFWHVFTARLAFIFIFEHVVFVLTGIIAWAIPDIPVEVKTQMMREKKVEREALYEAAMKRIRQNRQAMRNATPTDEDQMNVDLGEGLRSRPYSRTAAGAAEEDS